MAAKNQVRRIVGETRTPTVRGQSKHFNAMGHDPASGDEYEILSGIFKDVEKIAQKKAEEYGIQMENQGKADAARGKEMANPENEKYREQYMLAKGEADVIEYENQLMEWQADPKNVNASPEEFKAMAQKLRKQYLSLNDDDAYAIGFSDSLNVEAKHKQALIKRKTEKTHDNHISDVEKGLRANLTSTENSDMDDKSKAKDMRKQISDFQKELGETEGMPRKEANQRALEIVQEMAIKEEDPSMLDVFTMKDGSGQKAWVGATKLRMARRNVQMALDHKEEENKEDRKAKRIELMGRYATLKSEGKHKEAKELIANNGSYFSTSFVRSTFSEDGQEDDDLVRDILTSVYSDGSLGQYSEEDINRFYKEGRISHQKMALIQRLRAKGGYGGNGNGSGALSVRGFQKSFDANAYHLNDEAHLGPAIKQQATREYTAYLYDLLERYDPDSDEFQEKAYQMKQKVLDKYTEREIKRDYHFSTDKDPGIVRDVANGKYDELNGDTLTEFGNRLGDPAMTPAKAEEWVDKINEYYESVMNAKKKEEQEDVAGDTAGKVEKERKGVEGDTDTETWKENQNYPLVGTDTEFGENQTKDHREKKSIKDNLPTTGEEQNFNMIKYLKKRIGQLPELPDENPEYESLNDKILGILKYKGLLVEHNDWKGIAYELRHWKGLAYKLRNWKGLAYKLRDWKGILYEISNSQALADLLLPDDEKDVDMDKKKTIDELVDAQKKANSAEIQKLKEKANNGI